MLLPHPSQLIARLRTLQEGIRDAILASRHRSTEDLAGVDRASVADTIYTIDALVEPAIEAFCEEWSRETPLILIGEGFENAETGEDFRVFPRGLPPEQALIRVILDPIDGTRGLMYDKRPAWSLAAVAPNKGPGTHLRDCIVSVMTELPTSKMGSADVLYAHKGGGAHAVRVNLATRAETPLPLRPSRATDLAHGFAMISHFFPATKVAAGQLMNHILKQMETAGDGQDASLATIFDDQYISTGGQFYALAMGQDRFNADLRPLFHQRLGLQTALECHPYDLAGLLIAEEAGVIITDAQGHPLDAPLNTTTGAAWVGYANPTLRKKIEPALRGFFKME